MSSERRHQVMIARSSFEYEPVVDVPDWWTPGGRVTAGRGETVTVTQADYDRGRRYAAFVGVPPLPTREVTVLHGCFDYTPQPFPLYSQEWARGLALRGETVTVLEDDYERGKRAGSFDEWKPSSEYGIVGDPPLTGTIVAFHNWVRAAPPAAHERLLAHLDELAGSSAPSRKIAAEVRQLFGRTDTNGRLLAEAVNRMHELIGQMHAEAQPDDLAKLVEQIKDHLITNPEVIALVQQQQQERA